MLEVTPEDVLLVETLLATLREHEDEIGEEDPTALSETMTDTAALIRRMRAALPAPAKATVETLDEVQLAETDDIPL